MEGDSHDLKKRCLRGARAWMSEHFAAATVLNKSRPAYWSSLRSELEHNIAVFAEHVPAGESYGDIPLVLLSAGEQDLHAPPEVLTVIEDARRQTHERILAASRRSTIVEVPGAGHDIQLDWPEAIVAAVREQLGE